jgi:hypothetical protein
MQETIANHKYIKKLVELEQALPNRLEFHRASHETLLKIGKDQDFLKAIIRKNLTDSGFLNFEWSQFNIPFFYVYENDHMVVKIHLFPRDKDGDTTLAAHAVHHHNNYILSTNAFYGSGYEAFLFEKNPEVSDNLTAQLRVKQQFHQNEVNPHIVESWQPHVVICPESFSATILIWTPDQKRSTDKFRQHPLLKPIKKQIKWLAYALGLDKKIGVAAKHTFQFFPENNSFKAIREEDYFKFAKANKGDEINSFAAQMICYFLQGCELIEPEFLQDLLIQEALPAYYIPFINKLLKNEPIEEEFHFSDLNIPQKRFFTGDILNV